MLKRQPTGYEQTRDKAARLLAHHFEPRCLRAFFVTLIDGIENDRTGAVEYYFKDFARRCLSFARAYSRQKRRQCQKAKAAESPKARAAATLLGEW